MKFFIKENKNSSNGNGKRSPEQLRSIPTIKLDISVDIYIYITYLCRYLFPRRGLIHRY